MSQDSTGPDMGQDVVVSAEIPERAARDVDELIALLERHAKAIIRLTAVVTKHAAQITIIEEKLTSPSPTEEISDEPEPETDRSPAVIPPLALRSDGRVLLHVSDVEGVDLSARETWTGVLLNQAETADVLDCVAHGMSEAAGLVGGWIARAAKIRKKLDDEEGGES